MQKHELDIWHLHKIPIWRSTSCCTMKCCSRPSSPSAGIWNSFLHVWHRAFCPGLLSLNWHWMHLRQKAWKQGSDFGLSNCFRHNRQVVRSAATGAAVAMVLFHRFSIRKKAISTKTKSGHSSWKWIAQLTH